MADFYTGGGQHVASGADVQHSERKNCLWNPLNGGSMVDNGGKGRTSGWTF